MDFARVTTGIMISIGGATNTIRYKDVRKISVLADGHEVTNCITL